MTSQDIALNLFATPPRHLYIHWPFCKKKCHYCDFVAFEKHQEYTEQYHAALCAEVSAFADRFEERPAIDTIYIGGGTPSLWPLPLIAEMGKLLHARYDLSVVQEATIEVNPGGITREHFETWRSIGLNRLSIGVQILDETILEQLNRPQRTRDVEELLARAPQYFDNLSVDLIIGLPGVSDDVWWRTLEYVLSTPITHISIYFLTIHENTPLYFRLRKGILSAPEEDHVVDLYEHTIDRLARAGFVHYEISNFARPGYESRHNKAYWDRRAYKGFGLGAASFDGVSRTTNVKNLLRYSSIAVYSASAFDVPTFYNHTERMRPDQIALEVLMLGLRQQTGVYLHDVLYLIPPHEQQRFYENMEILKQLGLLNESGGRVVLSARGMILEHEILTRLLI